MLLEFVVALVPAFVPAPVPAVAGDAAPAEAEAGSPLAGVAFARVAFVGASVTAGFRASLAYELDGQPGSTSFDLASVVEAAHTGPGAFHSFGDLMFFGSPEKKGPKLLEQVVAEEPTLIVGLDFLFWYAYGPNDHEGRPIGSREQRFAKLELGLALLEPVGCTLVLGDLPDMSSAIGVMLQPSWVPDPETLAILNGKLYEWADEREHVIVLPLAETVARMHADRELRFGDHVWPAGSGTKTLLHEDRLHSTIDGMIALTQMLVERLDAAGLVDDAAFELDPEALKAKLRERALETARRKAELQQGAEQPVPAGG